MSDSKPPGGPDGDASLQVRRVVSCLVRSRAACRLVQPVALAAVLSVGAAVAVPQSHAVGEQARVAVLHGPQRSYRQAAAALNEILQSLGYPCVQFEVPKGEDESSRRQVVERLVQWKPTVIAAAGAAATTLALETVPDVPVVFFMVPNALDAPFLAVGHPARTRLAGVAADVSPADQIVWMIRLHRSGRKVALLHSSRTRRTAQALREAAGARGMALACIEADRKEFPQAIKALNYEAPDGVLMIPDARVYDSATVQRLLLWGLRHKKPVFAFSASIVKAGALAGQYCDCRVVGRQAAELVQKVIAGEPPGELGLQYPRRVARAVNRRTAELIGLALHERMIGAATVRYGERP